MRKKQVNQRMIIYGVWPVREALESNQVMEVFLAKGLGDSQTGPVMSAARGQGIKVTWISRADMDMMAHGHHQGVAASVRPVRYASTEQVWGAALAAKRNGPCVMLLDGILDPQNLGSILRSAVYFGVPGVIVPSRRCAPLSAVTVRASAGAALQIPIAEVSNLNNAMKVARDKGIWLVGADLDGQNIKTVDVPKPFALVLGSEGEGLHQLVKKQCDLIVSLPKFAKNGGVDSLNVGAACAAMLHHFS